MTTIQHTPGPWRVCSLGHIRPAYPQHGWTDGYAPVARVFTDRRLPDNRAANARLIAASPNLAVALLRCYTFLNDNFEDYDMPDILGPAREALQEAGLLVDASHAPARAREAALPHRDCGHSACGQHYIDTGETRCVTPDLYDPEDAADELACMREAASDRPVDDDEPDPTEGCAHDWNYTGTQYGGDDERFHGEGRVICRNCGADGDA